MKTEINNKRNDLVEDVKDSCEELVKIISEPGSINLSYIKYVECKKAIAEKADRVLEFNGFINDYFREDLKDTANEN